MFHVKCSSSLLCLTAIGFRCDQFSESKKLLGARTLLGALLAVLLGARRMAMETSE